MHRLSSLGQGSFTVGLFFCRFLGRSPFLIVLLGWSFSFEWSLLGVSLDVSIWGPDGGMGIGDLAV